MSVVIRLIGTDNQEIVDLDGWFAHAPPEGGDTQWVDGYSAKEQAKAWLRPGKPAVPVEIEYALGLAGFGGVERWTGYPEHQTKLDNFGRGVRGWRHHDMLLLLGDPESPDAVVGIEAKACEGYDGTVARKIATPAPSRLPDRCNLMSHALFGRAVCTADSRQVIDKPLGAHGYQLWTGSVGAIREAQGHDLTDAVFLVQQFAPGLLGQTSADKRAWPKKLVDNASQLRKFREALGTAPTTRQTDFIDAGTGLQVLAVCSLI